MDELSSCCGCVCVCGVGRGGGGGRLTICETNQQHAVEGYACDRDAEEGGRDGHREGGKARQGEPVQGAHQSAGDAKSEWRQAEGGRGGGGEGVCVRE